MHHGWLTSRPWPRGPNNGHWHRRHVPWMAAGRGTPRPPARGPSRNGHTTLPPRRRKRKQTTTGISRNGKQNQKRNDPFPQRDIASLPVIRLHALGCGPAEPVSSCAATSTFRMPCFLRPPQDGGKGTCRNVFARRRKKSAWSATERSRLAVDAGSLNFSSRSSRGGSRRDICCCGVSIVRASGTAFAGSGTERAPIGQGLAGAAPPILGVPGLAVVWTGDSCREGGLHGAIDRISFIGALPNRRLRGAPPRGGRRRAVRSTSTSALGWPVCCGDRPSAYPNLRQPIESSLPSSTMSLAADSSRRASRPGDGCSKRTRVEP